MGYSIFVTDPETDEYVQWEDASEEAKEAHRIKTSKILKKFGMDMIWKVTGIKFRFVHDNEEILEKHGRKKVKAFGILPVSLVFVQNSSRPKSGHIKMDYDDDGQWYYMVTPA